MVRAARGGASEDHLTGDTERADVAIVGAGAAGLMAAIWAGRAARARRIVLLDGARTLGAKILVAGGGRCNVTHDVVDEAAFAGSSPHAIRKVLLRFDVERTVAFFRELGVELKREETGKLFPTTDRARTVLDALLAAAREAGVEVRSPWRVERVERVERVGRDECDPRGDRFALIGRRESRGSARGSSLGAAVLEAREVILATGGKSLPKSGSDGHGYAIAQSLGHSLTPRVWPALVPLLLPRGSFFLELSGVSFPATHELRSGSGRRLVAFTGSTLCTHFGLSGPAPLDISRFVIDARADDAGARLSMNVLPGETAGSLEEKLIALGAGTVGGFLSARMPDRLARALCAEARVDPSVFGHRLTRDERRRVAAVVTDLVVPVAGDRGFGFAEATAGGVPLRELRLETMASRVCPGLSLCGEICDVDGRIGGYNFQWAWSSGYVAGISAGESRSETAC